MSGACASSVGRIVHVHAKDTRIDPDRLYSLGILGLGWHTPSCRAWATWTGENCFLRSRTPAIRDAVCIEVEDRAFEGSLADRQRSLRQSKRFLEQFVS